MQMEAHERRLTNTMKRSYRIRVGLYGVAVCALGMLIWARLMLVARPPRVAIAHPVPTQVEPSPSERAEPGRPADSTPESAVK